MKIYWCIGGWFGDYELFVARTPAQYKEIEDITNQIGARILIRGELDIDKADFNNLLCSSNPKIQTLVKTIFEAKETKQFNPTLLEARLKSESN